jgi:hypothetical protein
VGLRVTSLLACLLVAVALGGCGDTLQDQPIPHGLLESLIEAPFPVYWLGVSFHGMAVSEVSHDPGEAYTVQYGNCLQGGEGTCERPLRVVSSPDNSFLPGGAAASRHVPIRGVDATVVQAGRAIEIPTAGVVLDIYASSPSLARAAAETAVAINQVGAPQAPLPAPLANTGFPDTPLPTQVPPPLRPLLSPRAASARRSSCASRHRCARRHR